MATGPLPDVPNGIQIKIGGTLGGQQWLHVLHAVHDSSTPNGTDLASLCTAIISAWDTNISPLQTASLSRSLVQCTDISSRTGAVATNATVKAGGAAATNLPNSTAYAVGWTVSRRYRGGHPRTYHCGLISTQLNGTTQVSTTFRTSILNAWLALKTAIEATALTSLPNLKMCQVSYFHGKNADGTPALRPVPQVDLITGVRGDLRIDSQRHRLGKPV